MIKKNLRLIAFSLIGLLVVFSIGGCASLFKEKYAKVVLSSEPMDADVYIDGYNRGKTPLQLKLSHKKPVTITFKKEGYKDKTYVINTHTGVIWIILDVVGGFIPVVIDAATNNWACLDEDEVNVILEVERK